MDKNITDLFITTKELFEALDYVITSEETTLGDGGSIIGSDPRQYAIEIMKRAKKQIKKFEKLDLTKLK